MEKSLGAQSEHNGKDRTHEQDGEGEEEENPGQFSEQVFDARHRLGEDRVDRPVFHVLGQQRGGGEDGEQRAEDAHRAESDVFEHLEFFLEAEAREEK